MDLPIELAVRAWRRYHDARISLRSSPADDMLTERSPLSRYSGHAREYRGACLAGRVALASLISVIAGDGGHASYVAAYTLVDAWDQAPDTVDVASRLRAPTPEPTSGPVS